MLTKTLRQENVGQLMSTAERTSDDARRVRFQAPAAWFVFAAILVGGIGAEWGLAVTSLVAAAILIIVSYVMREAGNRIERDIEAKHGKVEQLRLNDSPKLEEVRQDLSQRIHRADRTIQRWRTVRNAGLAASCMIMLTTASDVYASRQVHRPGFYPIGDPLAPYAGYLNDPKTQPVAVANIPPQLLQPAIEADRTVTRAARDMQGNVADLIAGVEGNLPEKVEKALSQIEDETQAAKDALDGVSNGPFPPALQSQAREQVQTIDKLVSAAKEYKSNPTSATKATLNNQTKSFLEEVTAFLKELGEFIQALIELLNAIISGGSTGTGVSGQAAGQLASSMQKAASGQSISPSDSSAVEGAMRSGMDAVGPSHFASTFNPSAPPSTGGTFPVDGLLKPLEVPTQPRKEKADRGQEKTKERLDQKVTAEGVIPN